MIGYDNLSIDHQILLDLPFREATGLITHDVAKPHHIADGTGHNPSWDTVWPATGPSDLGILDFDGVAQYLEIPAATVALALDFTGDFALAAWIYPVYTAQAMVIMCLNDTFVCGWCMYLYDNPVLGPVLSLRTSQGGVPPDHTECYAAGFPDSEWQLVGFSRDSASLSATCYKNGQPVTTVLGPTGMLDPTACGGAVNLYIGRQNPPTGSYYKGKMWRPRAWPRKLSDEEWLQLFDYERHWFNV